MGILHRLIYWFRSLFRRKAGHFAFDWGTAPDPQDFLRHLFPAIHGEFRRPTARVYRAFRHPKGRRHGRPYCRDPLKRIARVFGRNVAALV